MKTTEQKISVWTRLTSEVPTFFRWVQGLAAGLLGLFEALLLIPGVPHWFQYVADKLEWISPVVALVAQFAVKQLVITPRPEGLPTDAQAVVKPDVQ